MLRQSVGMDEDDVAVVVCNLELEAAVVSELAMVVVFDSVALVVTVVGRIKAHNVIPGGGQP